MDVEPMQIGPAANVAVVGQLVQHSVPFIVSLKPCWEAFPSKIWSNFSLPLGKVPIVGGATMAKAEPLCSPFLTKKKNK